MDGLGSLCFKKIACQSHVTYCALHILATPVQQRDSKWLSICSQLFTTRTNGVSK